MRALNRRQTHDAGAWGGQLISLSDLMAGLLFVFIVIVLVFAYQLSKAIERHDDVVREFQSTQAIRTRMLQAISDNLVKRGLNSADIEINPETGVLSLRERILFPSGSTDLSSEGRRALTILAFVLDDVLPCYAGHRGAYPRSGCADTAAAGRLEAVFIEGHTDSIAVSEANRYGDNWNLSTARAISVFKEMMLQKPDLDELTNTASQPLFSISGYADRRPYGGNKQSNATGAGRALNRRIDVRFVMTYPRPPDPVRDADDKLASPSGR